MKRRQPSSRLWTAIAGFLVVAFLGAAAASDAAERYPVRSVEIMNPHAAGGAGDMVARIFAAQASPFLGQTLVLVNKPGAGAAASYVATARPDGYTLHLGGPGPYYIQPLTRKLAYTPASFRPICKLVTLQTGILVRSDAPWKTGTEWLEYVRQSPEPVPIGMNGGPNPSYVGLALVLKAAKIDHAKVKYVVFKGDGDAMPALLGGHVKVIAANTSAMRAQIDGGQFRVLGNFQETRSRLLPNVPTWKEQGYDVGLGVYLILAAPKGTPDAVVKVLDDACRKTAAMEAFATMLEKAAFEPDYADAAQTAKIMKEDFEKYRVLLSELGLLPKE